MRLQMLISGMNLDTTHVAENMKLEADAIVINQTDSFGFEEYQYNRIIGFYDENNEVAERINYKQAFAVIAS